MALDLRTETSESGSATGTADLPEPGVGGRGRGWLSSPWGVAARHGFGYWAIAMLGYLGITIAAATSDPAKSVETLFLSWIQWDSHWYLKIASEGYGAAGLADPASSYAFYPLFPLLIAGVDLVAPLGIEFAAFVVSVGSLLALLVVLYRFLDEELKDRRSAGRAIWYLMLFPTAFFLAAPYPMSLFLVLVVASIYCMRRGNWWAAGLWGALATASRLSAMLLGIVFVLEYLRQREWSLRRVRADVLAAALIPGGLLAYLAYCATQIGFLAPFSSQVYWGRDGLGLPWEGWLSLARTLLVDHDLRLYHLTDFVLVALVGLLLLAAIVGPWRLRRDQLPLVAFGVAVFLFAISFPLADPDPIKSANRYMLEVFPAFMVLAALGSRAWLDRAYVVLALPLQALLLVIHLQGGWVA